MRLTTPESRTSRPHPLVQVRMKTTPSSKGVPVARIVRGSHVAEIISDPGSQPPVYHCVISDRQSGEIVAWSQSHDLGTAEMAAEDYLREMMGGSRAA